MAVFEVPNLFTLQDAVDAALAGGNEAHYIDLTASPVFTAARVTIGPPPMGVPKWKLIVRPQPGDKRATIASSNGSQTIFSIGPNARDVTFNDLDIIRHSTNNADLIQISNGTRITFDRCRVGSDWLSVGSYGRTMLTMTYPIDILVRNCIFFSHMPGNFSRGIRAQYGDVSNSLRLYNNVIADYRRFGVDISSPHAESLVLLRNNVVINCPDLAAEPFAYRSDVVAGVRVVSSHNVAFASAGHEEQVAGAQPISALHTPTFLRWVPGAGVLDATFVDHTWNVAPPWNPNPHFYRLRLEGPLHDQPAKWGVDVLNHAPHPDDVAVSRDIEGNVRPSGIPPHTDRGADQAHAA